MHDKIITQKPKIVINIETKKELNLLGDKNDSYDDIIKRLILFFKNKRGAGEVKDAKKTIFTYSHLR